MSGDRHSGRADDPDAADRRRAARRHREVRADARALPRGRARRGRVPRLPPQQRHLRPAPGRPQPDGAGEGALRVDHARAARDDRLHRRRRTPAAGATSPPARTSSSTSSSSSRSPRCMRAPRVGRAHHPRGVRRHRAQRHGLPPRRRLPATRCSTSRPWAEAAVPALPAQPARAAPAPQVQDQLLRLRDRLRPGDVQRRRRDRASPAPLDDGTVEPGFRVFIAGGLGANPHPALALEEFTAREDLLPTIEAILRVFDHHGNRDNKLRARMKWLVDTLGIDELQRARPQGAQVPARPRRRGRAASPRSSQKHGDAPGRRRRRRSRRRRWARARRSRCGARDPYERWDAGQRRARRRQGHRVGRTPTPRSATSPPTSSGRSPRSSASSALDVRLTNRQNFVFRGLTEDQLPDAATTASTRIGMAEPGAELARDVVACPGADTCNLAVTQSRGLANAIGDALEEAGLAEVGGVRINISGCTNRCGQHHISDIGFFGAERRAHGQSAPGYQMLLGGYVGQEQIHFGEKALRLPAKNAPEAAVRVVAPVRRRARAPARRSARGSTAPAAPTAIGRRPQGPRRVPHARRRPRLLRRLRRDRSVRRRDRRVGVRHLTPGC